MCGTRPFPEAELHKADSPLEGEVHDLFWEWGVFGTLSLDFPVLAKDERLFGGPGAWAQGRLWPWPQQQT